MKKLSPAILGCALILFVPLAMSPAVAEVSAKSQKTSVQKTSNSQPWLYEGSDVPVDKAWTFGVLKNGLRYAVRHNGVPPGQVTVRIRVDAGSLMENKNELGYAHFLEHLTFRGSTHVPDGEAKRIWQRLGATFGSDSNAETTPTQTVYKLDLPNATNAGLEQSFKILSGMMQDPGLHGAAVEAEKPVVLAELKENVGPQRRITELTHGLLFHGQRLSARPPIGTVDTLNASTSKGLKAFHSKWYRPENTVIVVAGDGDPAIFEALLERHFANWKPKGKPTAHPNFGDPTIDGPKSAVAIEPSLPRSILLATLRPWRKVDDTIAYNKQILTDLLALQLINRRLEARARAGGEFLQANVAQDDVYRTVDGTFVNIVPLSDDWEAALADVRSVIADAIAHPPSADDIAREVSEFDAALAFGVESYASEPAAKQADSIVQAVDIREAIATPQTALDVFRDMGDMLTPDNLQETTKKLFEGTATRAFLTSPVPLTDGNAKLAAALAKKPVAANGARLQQSKVGIEALPELGPKGSVQSRSIIPKLDMERVILSNGVRVLLFPNDAERGKIMVKVRFGEGYHAFEKNSTAPIWSGEMALVASGVGDLGQEELDKISTGRRVGMNFEIDDDAFEFSADTRPADLKIQLHLLAGKLAAPRWDAAPILRGRAAGAISYDSYSASPQGIFSRDLQWLIRGGDKRWKSPDKGDFGKLTPADFRTLWEPVLASGPIEVMIFGDFERDRAMEDVLSSFGALKPRAKTKTGGERQTLNFPSPNKTPKILRHAGDKRQAAALIAWPTGGGMKDIRISRKLEILASIFSDRLFEQLRSQQGASYSPIVDNSWPTDFASGGYVAAMTQLSPENIDRFYDVSRKIAADLANNLVGEDELKRVVEPLRQAIKRASSGNSFWMSQMEGATYDPSKIKALRTVLPDYTVITPEEVQALAKAYLVDDRSWSLVILPESVNLAD